MADRGGYQGRERDQDRHRQPERETRSRGAVRDAVPGDVANKPDMDEARDVPAFPALPGRRGVKEMQPESDYERAWYGCVIVSCNLHRSGHATVPVLGVYYNNL